MSTFKNTVLTVVAASFAFGVTPRAMRAQADGEDAKIQQDLQKSLKGSRFKDVQVVVASGMIKMTGTVPVFQDKEDADKKAHHARKKAAIENEIEVAPVEISDNQLQAKLQKQLAYDRVGYGNAFNAITLSVHEGVVTFAGNALGPVARDSALSLASNTPGVRDVVDNIEVDPLSPMDDGTRARVARAVYGYPSLNKYAIDPAAPIRITVVNGHVTLAGSVLSQADRNVAGIQANSVPGVFSVTNNLQVENSSGEKSR